MNRPRHVVSVSLGSSSRDKRVETTFLGQPFIVERRGTDGDMKRLLAMIEELDGNVDAFGMGGIDLYLYTDRRRYTLKPALPIARAAKKTPIVDGSGVKNTLERLAVRYMVEELGMPLQGMKALMVSAVDRFGMAQALSEAGCRMTFGDLIFVLGVPIGLHSLRALGTVASILLPIVTNLVPFEMLYPTGEKQTAVTPRHARYYRDNELIAGDFHYIRRYMPEDMRGKIILTQTTTEEDVALLTRRGVRRLITTTPVFEGRSFATNVIEAVLITLAGRRPDEMAPDDYLRLIRELDLKPTVRDLNS